MGDDFAATVRGLRISARARARTSPRPPFDGEISDDTATGSAVRRYAPNGHSPTVRAVFLHGGYGVFGDLDLQDAWCRRLSTVWSCELVSVDYPLAPEHSFVESVDAVACVLNPGGSTVGDATPVILCGDSAGAALALAVAAHERVTPAGLFLTNPNVDLTLTRFDANASDGPDAEISARAFAEWTRGWLTSSDFVTAAGRLPPTFIAVGRHDAVLPEARDLGDALAAVGQRVELVEYDVGHGFLGDATVSDDVLTRASRFFRT